MSDKSKNKPIQPSQTEIIKKELDLTDDQLKKIPEPTQKKLIAAISESISVQSYYGYRGLLPHFEHAQEYEKILPGSFDRILKMAEDNNQHAIERDNHDIEMEKLCAPKALANTNRGQIFAFIIVLFGLTAGTICTLFGKPTVGAIFGGMTIITVTPYFIYGLKKLITKKEDTPSPHVEETTRDHPLPQKPKSGK